MTFTKGQSGNKLGRPSTGRMLAKALRKMGDHDSYGDLSNQTLIAQMIWEALAWGHIRFAGGEMINLSAREWLDLVKWLHSHVDGVYQPEPVEEEKAPEKEVWGYGPDNLPLEVILERGRQEREAEARRIAEAEVMRIEDGAYQPEEIEPEEEVPDYGPDNPPLEVMMVDEPPKTEQEAWGYGHVHHEAAVNLEDDPQYLRKAEAGLMRLMNGG